MPRHIKFQDTAAWVPQAIREAANAALEAAGFGPNNFSRAVGPAAGHVITHYVANPKLSATDEEAFRDAVLAYPGATFVRGRLRDAMASNGLAFRG